MILSIVVLASLLFTEAEATHKIVIAHRGASGYLPEHTLEAKTLAVSMGADFVEQDMVLTADNKVIVHHDIFLDLTTDVATRFPNRHEEDGRYYAINFTMSEIQTLRVTDRFHPSTRLPVYPDRFPMWKSVFRVRTLEEELELIQALPILAKYGYKTKSDNIYLQCFDPNELQGEVKRVSEALEMDLKLVQLIATWNETFYNETLPNGTVVWREYHSDWMLEAGGMERVRKYADGVGPHIGMIVSPNSTTSHFINTGLVDRAHAAGLVVHPYTFRKDDLPDYAGGSFTYLLRLFYDQVGVDGVFTDFPDLAVKFLHPPPTNSAASVFSEIWTHLSQMTLAYVLIVAATYYINV